MDNQKIYQSKFTAEEIDNILSKLVGDNIEIDAEYNDGTENKKIENITVYLKQSNDE